MDLSCNIIFPKNPPIISVRQWKSKDTYLDIYFVGKAYSDEIKDKITKMILSRKKTKQLLKDVFGDFHKIMMNSNNLHIIFEPIFKDDIIDKILLKILYYLSAYYSSMSNTSEKILDDKLLPYIWNNDKPLRFNFTKNEWSGYNINPYYAINTTKIPDNSIQQIASKIKEFTILEFITYADFCTIKAKDAFKKYYFPNEKDILNKNEINTANYEQKSLIHLWEVPSKIHEVMIKNNICNYNRAFFSGKLNSDKSYKEIFDMLHTSPLISFIQFFDDINNIYYKVYKDHTIDPAIFDEWTNTDLLNSHHCITMYSFINIRKKTKHFSYMKFVMDKNKDILISYKVDSSEILTYDVLQTHLSEVISNMNTQLNTNILLKIERLATKTSISSTNNNLNKIANYFTKFPMIFNILNATFIGLKNNNIQSLEIQYIRVEKYGQSFDVVEQIKFKRSLGIPIIDIIQELAEYGITKSEVEEYIEQANKDDLPVEKAKKRDFKSLGIMISITQHSLGLNIYINNASSFAEIQHALFWMRAAISLSSSEKSDINVLQKPSSLLEKDNETSESDDEKEEILEETKREFYEDNSDDVSFELSESENYYGGALPAAHKGYFKKMLGDLDADIFTKFPNYSKKCAVSDMRQPIGMTLAQKKNIDSAGYSDGYDNYIYYGSNSKKKNIYICPKIYCPRAQIPLSYEKFKNLGFKCPDEKDRPPETPLVLYYKKKDIEEEKRKKSRFIGFLTKEKQRVPCCFIGKKQQPNLPTLENESSTSSLESSSYKNQTESPSSVAASSNVKIPTEKGYIFDKLNQLLENRYGSIPSSLHYTLYKNIPYSSCTQSIRGNECVLRKGIPNNSDSLMESIAYLLSFKNKKELCEHIEKVLDPFTFITLENGDVCSYFMPDVPIIPEDNTDNLDSLKKWLTSHTKYIELFKLKEILHYLDKKTFKNVSCSSEIKYKIARQFMIHASYTRFINYLYDKELTNPYMLYDLTYHLGAVLIVWDRNEANLSTMKCPYTTKNKEWYSGNKQIPYIMVIMQHNKDNKSLFYEPLVIVDHQYKNITQKISFTKFEKIHKLIGTCPEMMNYEDKQIQDLYSLKKWIDWILSNKLDFKIKSLLLGPDNRGIGCFLQNNIYIEFPIKLSVFSLKNTVERCDITELLYWEDIQHNILHIKCNNPDLSLLGYKIKKLNFGMTYGEIEKVTETTLKGIYSVPIVIYSDTPKFQIIIKDNVIKKTNLISSNNEKWHNIKHIIIKKLFENYDTLVEPLLKLSKKNQLKALLKVFQDLDEPSYVAVIIEEISYYDKTLLKKHLENILLEKDYYYKDTIIHEDKDNKEWIFSQKAIKNNLLDNIKYPRNINRPNNEPKISEEIIKEMPLFNVKTYPDLLNKEKLILKDIPKKWKSLQLEEYKIGELPNYSKHSLIEVFEWVAAERGITLDIEDLRYYLRKQIYLMLADRSTYKTILDDPVMLAEWNKVFKRTHRNSNELIKVGFDNKSVNELQEMWKVVSKSPNLMINDIDFYNISKLLNINFLILQRGKNPVNTTVENARKRLDEMIISSTFICSSLKQDWENFPLFIFYKYISDDKTHNIYSIFVSDHKISYFEQGYSIPQKIKNIIVKHIEILKKKSDLPSSSLLDSEDVVTLELFSTSSSKSNSASSKKSTKSLSAAATSSSAKSDKSSSAKSDKSSSAKSAKSSSAKSDKSSSAKSDKSAKSSSAKSSSAKSDNSSSATSSSDKSLSATSSSDNSSSATATSSSDKSSSATATSSSDKSSSATSSSTKIKKSMLQKQKPIVKK